MKYLTSILINGPLVVLNIVANAFYMFCMVCPLHGERIKQPLKLLLGSLICCSIIYLMSVSVMIFSVLRGESIAVTQIAYVVAGCSFFTSMTSSVWLTFFYYMQIVPAQRALFIWIKKNIKSIIYCIWLVERIYSLFDYTITFANSIANYGIGSNNFTIYHDMSGFPEWLVDIFFIVLAILRTHFVFCLCVMVMSNGSTVVYLCRHMRRMAANGQPLSCPVFSSQVRVTVTGAIQGVLYVSCAVWNIYFLFAPDSFTKYFTIYTHFTVINLYMSGTTFNLGAGQAVFRQRAADIWLRAARCCKQSEQGG